MGMLWYVKDNEYRKIENFSNKRNTVRNVEFLGLCIMMQGASSLRAHAQSVVTWLCSSKIPRRIC